MASSKTCALLMVIVIAIQCSEHFVNSVITDVRLVGGPSSNKGTVELRQNNGTWETTCGVNLNTNDVTVICRQLGFSGANRAIPSTPYGQSSISQNGLTCEDGEATLFECTVFLSQSCSAAGAATCHENNYIGCFRDMANDRVFPGENLLNDPKMTIAYCIQFCNETFTSDNIYAGLENGDECFCGTAGANYARHGEGTDINCQVPCSGDHTESCGAVGFIAVHAINIQTTMPPREISTESMETTQSVRDIPSTPPPSMMTTIRRVPSVLPQNGGNQGNIGIYAGVSGGVVVIIIIIVAMVLVVVVRRRRAHGQQKDRCQSHDMTVMPPSSPKGGQDNLYHNMFVDTPDETLPNLQLPDPPADADNTYYSSVRDQLSPKGNEMYYSSVKDQESPEGGDMYYSSVKDHQAAGEDLKLVVNLDQTDGLPNKENGRAPLNGEAEAMYASADEPRPTSKVEDFSSLYAKPDKAGNDAKGQASGDFGALYALPDKTRGVPEGQEDVKVGDLYAMPDKSRGNGRQGEQESDHNNGEGPYSLADDDIGLHVSSESPGLTVNPDDAEYGTVMVDNELYAM